MKKTLGILALIIMLMLVYTNISLADADDVQLKEVLPKASTPNIYINNQFLIEGYVTVLRPNYMTIVHFKPIAEALGYKSTLDFTGDDITKWTVVLTRPDMEIKYTNNSSTVYANGKTYHFPITQMTVPYNMTSRPFDPEKDTFIPVRWLAEMSNATVEWVKTSLDEPTYVYITYPAALTNNRK